MRVVDLDRDMSDVIPTGLSPDSEFLFARMTEATLDATCAYPHTRILDVASGVGQDSVELARTGARVVAAPYSWSAVTRVSPGGSPVISKRPSRSVVAVRSPDRK